MGEVALARLLASVDPSRPVYAWIVLGAYVGLRSAESASFMAANLEENGKGAAVRMVGKGGVERLVPAPPLVVQALEPWVSQARGSQRLWPDATPPAVQSAIRRAAEALGISCSSHQLRHRYGTALYRASRDLLLTQQLMGHSSPTTTAGYALVDMHSAAGVVSALPGVITSPGLHAAS